MDDPVSRLLEAITEAERLAQYRNVSNEHVPPRCADESWHTMKCGYYQGEHMEPCDCPVPAAVLRRCAADRRRLERHAPTEPGIGHFGSSRFKDTDTRICSHCSHDGDWEAVVFPCPDFLDLMDSYGLPGHREDEE